MENDGGGDIYTSAAAGGGVGAPRAGAWHSGKRAQFADRRVATSSPTVATFFLFFNEKIGMVTFCIGRMYGQREWCQGMM